LLGVEGTDVGGAQLRVFVDESFEAVMVPAVRLRRAVSLNPLEKRINDGGQRVRGEFAFDRAGEELFVLLERLVLVGTEIDLLAAERDVPDAPRGAKPRLGELFHF
jgi:hypothetical protein